jgi:two-component system, cell cycle sensor histidine kinase and response regulator CckA
MEFQTDVREVSRQMLKYLGYEVIACGDGAEAIRLYKLASETRKPFAAAILCLSVPGGMGGKEAAQHILTIDFDARLIISSGDHMHPVLVNFDPD